MSSSLEILEERFFPSCKVNYHMTNQVFHLQAYTSHCCGFFTFIYLHELRQHRYASALAVLFFLDWLQHESEQTQSICCAEAAASDCSWLTADTTLLRHKISASCRTQKPLHRSGMHKYYCYLFISSWRCTSIDLPYSCT